MSGPGIRDVEPSTVIRHREEEEAVVGRQAYLGMVGVGMLEDVVDCLEGDPVQLLLGVGR